MPKKKHYTLPFLTPNLVFKMPKMEFKFYEMDPWFQFTNIAWNNI